MRLLLGVFFIFVAQTLTFAHVDLLYPIGGETFKAGQVVKVEWKERIPHNTDNWDLYFSPDNGVTWLDIQIDIPTNKLYFDWVVPDMNTIEGKIKIIQDNGGNNYSGVSKKFEIQAKVQTGNALFIPDTLSGSNLDLRFQKGQVGFYPGFSTNTYGYNQDYLGPTLMLNQNQEVTLNVTNDIGETTTVHWHGLHVSSENDGGPHTVIEAGATWSPSFTVLDHAATYWYHPHLHEKTEEHVTKGGAGFIIVKDNEEAQLTLPRNYGKDDFPVVIQSRAFDANKQFMTKTALDDVILTNGTLDAYLDIPAQIVRLRLLNGSTERVYNLGLQGNRTFYQITSDGGLLNQPVALTRLRLSPGERAEILLDVQGQSGKSFDLMSFASELPRGIYGAANPSVMPVGSIPGYNNNALNGADFTVLKLNVVDEISNAVKIIPGQLVVNTPYRQADAQVTRVLDFTSAQRGPDAALNGPFLINNKSFDLRIIDYTVPLSNTEIWELTNRTAISHPFHIHDVQFFILDINGVAPAENMRGRKDVVLVPPQGGTVRFITKFDDFANEDVPFMFHCHMLSHEDAGMMGQFIVKDKSTLSTDLSNDFITIYPNPTVDIVTLSGLENARVEIWNSSGIRASGFESIGQKQNGDVQSFDLSGLNAGVYFIHIHTSEGEKVYKVIKE